MVNRTSISIYVLAHGQVAESGTHADLMALGGRYADPYTIQASQYEPPPGKLALKPRPARRTRETSR